MIRIVGNKEKPKPQAPVKEPPKLTYKSNILLQVMGMITAVTPDAIEDLLGDYDVKVPDNASEEQLANILLDAISQKGTAFQQDLAELIMDQALDSAYDSFDFKSLLSNAGGTNGQAADQSPGSGGGLLGNITGVLGNIGSSISNNISQRKQASSQTLQGILAYKQQQAQSEQSKGKQKTQMLLGLFFLLGICVVALIAGYRKRQQIQQRKLIQPKP